MDDILPLTIYVVAMAEVSHMVSHFNMLEDFIKINESQGFSRGGGINYEAEKRMLTNFNCGVLYVSKEWEIPKQPESDSLKDPLLDIDESGAQQ